MCTHLWWGVDNGVVCMYVCICVVYLYASVSVSMCLCPWAFLSASLCIPVSVYVCFYVLCESM
eukprot:m.963222 g.963222  ORF g.963222 m.963222 type:complete len:63 (+) comp23894_c0_seq1:1183-1371(+)